MNPLSQVGARSGGFDFLLLGGAPLPTIILCSRNIVIGSKQHSAVTHIAGNSLVLTIIGDTDSECKWRIVGNLTILLVIVRQLSGLLARFHLRSFLLFLLPFLLFFLLSYLLCLVINMIKAKERKICR